MGTKEELIPKTKLIFKKRNLTPFVISNRSEGELVKHLERGSVLKIWGQPHPDRDLRLVLLYRPVQYES